MAITLPGGKQRRWAGTFGTVANITHSVTTASSVNLSAPLSDVTTFNGGSTVSTIVNEVVLPSLSATTSGIPIEGQEIWFQENGPTGTPRKTRLKSNNPAAGTVQYWKFQVKGDTVGLKVVGGAYVPITVQGSASQSTAT